MNGTKELNRKDQVMVYLRVSGIQFVFASEKLVMGNKQTIIS
jgi:hypothetical protein